MLELPDVFQLISLPDLLRQLDLVEIVLVQLSNETREVAVLEIAGKNLFGEFIRIADHERVAGICPAHDVAKPIFLQHLEKLFHKIGALALLHYCCCRCRRGCGGSCRCCSVGCRCHSGRSWSRGRGRGRSRGIILLMIGEVLLLGRTCIHTSTARGVAISGHEHTVHVRGNIYLRVSVCLCHVSHTGGIRVLEQSLR